MSFVADFRRILTLDCRESSRLLSEALDRELRMPERVALRLHTIGCWSCRRLKRQLAFLRHMAQRFETRATDHSDSESSATPSLSEEAQQRMKHALRQQRGGPSSS